MAKKRNIPGFSNATGQGPVGRVRSFFSRGSKNAAGQVPGGAAHLTGAPVVHTANSQMMKRGLMISTTAGATKALGHTHGMLSRVNQIAVFGGVMAGVLGSLGKLPGIGKPFAAAADVALKPGEVMQNTTVGEAGHAGSKLLERAQQLSAKRVGEDARVTQGLGRVQDQTLKVETQLAGRLRKAADKVAMPLGNMVEEHGGDFLGNISGLASRGADKQLGKANAFMDSSLGLYGENDVMTKFNSAMETARGAIGGSVADIDREAAGAALAEAAKELDALPKGTLGWRAAGKLKKGVEKTAGALGSAQQKKGLAEKVEGLPESIKSAPENFSQANLSTVALKGAAATGTAYQLASTVHGISGKIHVLKNMYCDLTGEKKISTRKLLFSKKMPDVVKEARSHIIKEYGPRIALNFANTAATYTFMKNTNMKSMAGSFGLMGISSIHAAKVQSYGILPLYEALSQSPQIQDVQYAAFIASASKDARAAGGMENPIVQALAMEYAEAGVRPQTILAEIESGRFDERAMEKMRQGQEQAANQPAGRPGMNVQPQPEAMGAYTQRLQQENAARPQQMPAGR